MTASTLIKPVKGLVFKHSVRKNYDGTPLECTITSVSKDKIYWTTRLWHDKRFNTPLDRWYVFCGEVVSTPEAKVKVEYPKLTDAQCAQLHKRAHAAGLTAGSSARPMTMIVGSPTTPLGNDIDPTRRIYVEEGGICGFFYINIRPGNSSFARWAKKNLGAWSGFYGGTQYSVRDFGQSYERKSAYATAYTQVLRDAGIKAFAEGRVD